MSSGKSVSAEFREEGNAILNFVKTTSLAPAAAQGRLINAINKYYRAIETAGDAKEKASALKNHAWASYKLATILERNKEDWKNCTFRYKESVQHFIRASREGKCFGQDWLKRLDESFETSVKSAVEAIQNFKIPIAEKIKSLKELVVAMTTHPFSARCNIGIATLYFQKSILVLQNNDYKESLKLLNDCNFHIEEAITLSKTENNLKVLKEAESLKNDVSQQFYIAEAMQAQAIGDKLLHKVLHDTKELNQDMTYDIVDWYKKAIILTREKGLKAEAIAFSRVGKIFYKILKQTDKGEEYLIKSVDLAKSLPTPCKCEEWYKEAKNYLEEIEKVRNVKDSAEVKEEKQTERESYLKSFEQDMKKLESLKGLDASQFIEGIYSSWPPKKEGHTPVKPSNGTWCPDSTKTALSKAKRHYHPDGQNEEKYGKGWKYFCEEIFKCINVHYEHLK